MRNWRTSGVVPFGVSGLSLDVPISTDEAAKFERFFEHVRTHPAVDLSDVDAFTAAVDNWGTSAINGRYSEAAQLQAERAWQRFYVNFNSDAYASLMLDQAKQMLANVRKTVASQAVENVTASRQTAAVAGAGTGLLIAGVVLVVMFMSGRK